MPGVKEKKGCETRTAAEMVCFLCVSAGTVCTHSLFDTCVEMNLWLKAVPRPKNIPRGLD